jgi:glutamate-1-semialdehyde 2,1-aminomutase
LQVKPSSRQTPKSHALYLEALQLFPGAVNSPVRAFKSVGSEPLFIDSAEGAYLLDVDANRYIDLVLSWGPMIHGHADRDIEAAVIAALHKGSSYGAPTEVENKLAKEIIKLVPSVEILRMVNSGTEAVMSAIRLARAYTMQHNPSKKKIIKFTGCYHGHVDPLLVHAGSGLATLGLPSSQGVLEHTVQDTIVLPFNDISLVEQTFARSANEISAIILEPIVGNAGCILPKPSYLVALQEIARAHNSLLIFDEVMTGFRVAAGGAQELYGIKPDITTFGKIIGGGFPVGAYGASKEIMSLVAPLGPVYQAGTLSGNPIAMTAGLVCLQKLQRANFYQELHHKTKYLIDGFRSLRPDLQYNYATAMFSVFFTDTEVYSYETALQSDSKLFSRFHAHMLASGVYWAPSAFEAGFLSAAHSYSDLDTIIEAFATFK